VLMMGSSYLQEKKLSRANIRLVFLPVCLAVIALVYFGFRELILTKPNSEDLVGKYHLSKVTVTGFDQSRLKNYSLTFFQNGKYVMTPISDVDLGETGTYKVNYKNSLNEIDFTYKYEFGNAGYTVHIDRGLGSYRIEFVIDDPVLGESYFFEKDKP
jgi:hypothetical protein